ncbi:unnamed protein product [Notodromas monacha]|uniref:beta-N-acetylhexosaminidase n=1 Tax=Notodromas monacha TaxID=399045 RepID=A0A7R9BNS8_9CRUS|nr:unnamed protein product [Notodromas monacha]CAG0918897.1 unnamed protein product [Notodromas monacha]
MFQIEDAPMYKHRGVSLDTSRNFFPISDLKRIVDGLAMNKLNVFHWHMTDTHSFPFNVTKWPQMASDGAYSSDMVYQPADVKDFVEYARMRGVKVIPELDAPAHCGNGWTWGNELGLGDLVWCANEDPWYDLCVEPPCGQLNPLNENVFQVRIPDLRIRLLSFFLLGIITAYLLEFHIHLFPKMKILRDIYAEWSTLFDTDLIHLGGDELSKKCWEREPSVQSWIAKNASAVEESKRIVYFWWEAFQKRAENLLETAFGKNHDVILWTSALTKDGIEFLDKDKHVIQIWTESNNKEIGNLLRLGFRLIMSNVDALYLDCGFQAWVGDGHNWCSPYKTWQQIYDNDPRDIMKQHAPEMSDEAIERLSLGAEGALWTEQVDVASVDSRLFPRLVALAERLWTRPKNARTDKVLWRLQAQRSRMMYLGVNSDALLPEWCMQNEGRCTRLPQDRKLEIDDGGLDLKKRSPWTWECNWTNETCERVKRATSVSLVQTSYEACRIACGSYGRLWPKPTGNVDLGRKIGRVTPSKFLLFLDGERTERLTDELRDSFFNFLQRIQALAFGRPVDPRNVGIDVRIMVASDAFTLDYNTDESYELTIESPSKRGKNFVAAIDAKTYFGARHAFETLSQLIAFDEFLQSYYLVTSAKITDSPVYKHRGVMLDTSRNFFPISDLKRIVDGLAMNKLNVFHWHMTDTHSFPFNVTKWPQMASEGSYASDMVYQPADVKDFVEYARMRGVKVIPELDAPAHCGNGWTWGNELGLGDLVWCANEDPWYKLCVEPPCGQLNPLNDGVFTILHDIYAEWSTIFDKDMIHLGGDELSEICWTREKVVKDWISQNAAGMSTSDAIKKLWWEAFEKRAEQELGKSYNANASVILWTSGLTEAAEEYLDPRKHIVQVWSEANDKGIGLLANASFRLIMSNVDALYMDCGFQAWVGDGHNWCSPYKTWQGVYDNDPIDIITSHSPGLGEETIRELALGAEAVLWTEQADDVNVFTRLFPRVAALGERLWTRPANGTRRDQDAWRLQAHGTRMKSLGILGDALLPQYCMQNEGKCEKYPDNADMSLDDRKVLSPVDSKWTDVNDWRRRKSVMFMPAKTAKGLLEAAFMDRPEDRVESEASTEGEDDDEEQLRTAAGGDAGIDSDDAASEDASTACSQVSVAVASLAWKTSQVYNSLNPPLRRGCSDSKTRGEEATSATEKNADAVKDDEFFSSYCGEHYDLGSVDVGLGSFVSPSSEDSPGQHNTEGSPEIAVDDLELRRRNETYERNLENLENFLKNNEMALDDDDGYSAVESAQLKFNGREASGRANVSVTSSEVAVRDVSLNEVDRVLQQVRRVRDNIQQIHDQRKQRIAARKRALLEQERQQDMAALYAATLPPAPAAASVGSLPVTPAPISVVKLEELEELLNRREQCRAPPTQVTYQEKLFREVGTEPDQHLVVEPESVIPAPTELPETVASALQELGDGLQRLRDLEARTLQFLEHLENRFSSVRSPEMNESPIIDSELIAKKLQSSAVCNGSRQNNTSAVSLPSLKVDLLANNQKLQRPSEKVPEKFPLEEGRRVDFVTQAPLRIPTSSRRSPVAAIQSNSPPDFELGEGLDMRSDEGDSSNLTGMKRRQSEYASASARVQQNKPTSSEIYAKISQYQRDLMDRNRFKYTKGYRRGLKTASRVIMGREAPAQSSTHHRNSANTTLAASAGVAAGSSMSSHPDQGMDHEALLPHTSSELTFGFLARDSILDGSEIFAIPSPASRRRSQQQILEIGSARSRLLDYERGHQPQMGSDVRRSRFSSEMSTISSNNNKAGGRSTGLLGARRVSAAERRGGFGSRMRSILTGDDPFSVAMMMTTLMIPLLFLLAREVQKNGSLLSANNKS